MKVFEAKSLLSEAENRAKIQRYKESNGQIKESLQISG